MPLTEELRRCVEHVRKLSPEQKAKWVDLVLALTLRSRPSLFREAGLLSDQMAASAPPERTTAPPQKSAPRPQPPATAPQQTATEPTPPDKPVRQFDLDPHVIELLEGAGLDTWRKVAEYRAEHGDLTAIKGIGKATDAEIVRVLGLE